MRIAYLVFAYKNPKLIKRAIDALSSENSAFFIHIDSKSRLEDFRAIQGENVFFSERRLPVYWAEFSGVQAIMLLIDHVLASAVSYDYLVLLSGSEYPIRSRHYIESFLNLHAGSEFIRLVKVPAPGKPLSRFTTVWYESRRPIRRFIWRALTKFGLARRDYQRYLGDLAIYSGRTWWALTREACAFIMGFTQSNPRVADFFRDTFAPEESFFHTILGNSEFRSRVRGNVLYEDWSAAGSHPEMLNDRHVRFFESCQEVFDLQEGPSELLFARKFSDENWDLLDRIDEMIRRKEGKRGSLGDYESARAISQT